MRSPPWMMALVWNRMQTDEKITKPALIASCRPLMLKKKLASTAPIRTKKPAVMKPPRKLMSLRVVST
ncbi:hypothetical protein D9M71_850450 [compost metagenome]